MGKRCVLNVSQLRKILNIPVIYHKDFLKFVTDEKPSKEALSYFKRAGLSSEEGNPAFPVSLVGEEFKKKLTKKPKKGSIKDVSSWNTNDFCKFFMDMVKAIHKKSVVIFPKQRTKIKRLIDTLKDNSLLMDKMAYYIKNPHAVTWAHTDSMTPSIDVFFRAINDLEVSRSEDENEGW